MSLYVPAMMNADKSQMIYNAKMGMANSFLDGVRMAEAFKQSRQRMKNENERLQLQKDRFAFDKDTTGKELGMQQQRLNLAKAGDTSDALAITGGNPGNTAVVEEWNGSGLITETITTD